MVKIIKRSFALVPKSKRKIFFQLFLVLAGLAYYLFFVNKGISSFDEGYFVHSAERIYNNEVPYKDFFLQYGPTYSYGLVIFYKLLGVSILSGRIFSLIICMSIIASVFYLLNLLKIKSYKFIFFVFLSLISFGYPLINIPNIIWGNVLMSILLLIFCFLFYDSGKKKTKYLVFMGIVLALSLSLKQNLGILYIILYNFFFLCKDRKNVKETTRNLLIVNLTWFISTFLWVYYFFLRENFTGLIDYLNFSRNFIVSYGFSYPPLVNFLKPLGVFKQVPYYVPIVLFFVILLRISKKDKNWKVILISFSSCLGFFVSIYPQSDLLHCFPFFGLILVSLLLVFYKRKFYKVVLILISVSILIGFYLTFFAIVYDNYYLKVNTPIDLPRAKGIFLTKFDADSFKNIGNFIDMHTKRQDYIFVYPYHPIFYFILDRRNPSKDAVYYPRSWHFYDDKIIMTEIRKKKVKYILVYRAYIFGSNLSHFIVKQKKVYSTGTFIIFEITNFN